MKRYGLMFLGLNMFIGGIILIFIYKQPILLLLELNMSAIGFFILTKALYDDLN